MPSLTTPATLKTAGVAFLAWLTCLANASGAESWRGWLEERLTADPPSLVYLSLDRTPAEELAILHRLRDRFPQHGLIAHRLALLQFHLGYYEQAETSFRAARRLSPDLEFMMFHALQVLEKTPKAGPLPAYREALQLDHRHPEARWAVAWLSAAAGQWTEAVEQFRRWETLPPAAPAAWQAAARYVFAVAALMSGNSALLASQLEALERLSPPHWRLEMLRGHQAVGEGRIEEAIARYGQARRMATGTMEPAVWLGAVSARSGRWDTALEALAEVRSGDPTSPRRRREYDSAIQGAIQAARERGDRDLAARLVALEPSREDLQELVRDLAARTEDAQRLEARLGEALARETWDPATALAQYEGILRDYPHHPVARQKLETLSRAVQEEAARSLEEARRWHQAGQPHRALYQLAALLARAPRHAEARALQAEIQRRLAEDPGVEEGKEFLK